MRLRFSKQGASTPLWGVESCSPQQAAQPNPSYPALCRQDTTSPWSTDYGGSRKTLIQMPAINIFERKTKRKKRRNFFLKKMMKQENEKHFKKQKIEEMNKKWEKRKFFLKKTRKIKKKKKKKKKKREKNMKEKRKRGPNSFFLYTHLPRWSPKLIFYIRTVKRNRNEIEGLPKKSDFEHPTKKNKMIENDRK